MLTKKKSSFKMPTAYTVLIFIILVLAGVSFIVADPMIKKASISDVVMTPILGFKNAMDVSLFVLVIGGFLGVINKTGVLYNAIAIVVKKLGGRELLLIPILMIIFSIGGTTFGMAEETVAFYSLIVATMMAAGFDSIVGAAIILLGAGAGVLGSTINPFAISVAVDTARESGVETNQGKIIFLGAILWITTIAICIWFVMSYAKKVHNNLGRSILSSREKDEAMKMFSSEKKEENAKFSLKDKVVLILFGLSFLIMILSLIPWEDFGITAFRSWTSWLTGEPFGGWYFQELSAWFFIMSVVIGIIYRFKEREIVEAFISGASDMIGVALVIAVSRGISVIMTSTNLSEYFLTNAASALGGMSPILFTVMAYIIYIGLSFLIPSTSGLATGSMGIFAPLAVSLGLSPNVMIIIFSAACGLVNLVTPTSGVVMGGLAIAKIEYTSWIKFVAKVIATIFIVDAVILSIAMFVM